MQDDMKPGCHFSFWKWFFATAMLIKHMKDLWDEGYVSLGVLVWGGAMGLFWGAVPN